MNVNDASSILIDNSKVMLQIVASLTDSSRGIIYNGNMFTVQAGNTKGGNITVPLTSSLTGLELAVQQLKFLFLFAKHTNPNQSNRRSMVQ
jgi:hypothetical protein